MLMYIIIMDMTSVSLYDVHITGYTTVVRGLLLSTHYSMSVTTRKLTMTGLDWNRTRMVQGRTNTPSLVCIHYTIPL